MPVDTAWHSVLCASQPLSCTQVLEEAENKNKILKSSNRTLQTQLLPSVTFKGEKKPELTTAELRPPLPDTDRDTPASQSCRCTWAALPLTGAPHAPGPGLACRTLPACPGRPAGEAGREVTAAVAEPRPFPSRARGVFSGGSPVRPHFTSDPPFGSPYCVLALC